MSDLLRLLGGIVFLALSALTTIAAPNHFLWRLSIAVTEGGHWLALGALVPAIPWRGQGFLGKVGLFEAGVQDGRARPQFSYCPSTTPSA